MQHVNQKQENVIIKIATNTDEHETN